jgi:cell fate regulator YaaT (PSP1 superfamily)
VVCRTARGLEVGEVLRAPSIDEPHAGSDGILLRRVTPEDDLLIARLERNRQQAYEACVRLLADRQLHATLIEVEHLFDGQSLYFYFLGDVTPEIDQLTQELATAYEAKVQFRQFTDALERGCGPDCGTDAASGCGTESGCASCAIASACKP